MIYIDPPYNTGNKDWVYNDRYVGANDRWRHCNGWSSSTASCCWRDLLSSDGVLGVDQRTKPRAAGNVAGW